MSRKGLLLLGCVALAQGYTTFSTTCTTPTTPANFVTSAGSRGTLDILWSCLFTIFACTWTIQHLNVPEQRENRDPGWRGDIKWALKRFWTSTKWMLATAIAPEVLLAKAWGELMVAKETLVELQEFATKDGVSWTLTHSLFANMGGFVIRWDLGERGLKETHDTGTQSLPPEKATYTNPFHITAQDILEIRRKGVIKRLPDFTVQDINDKSKTDPFARTIAIFQILWTAIQIIARAVRQLAISQLEIATIAFAACAVIIYGLNWKKPKGVEVPYTILQYADEIPKQVRKVIAIRDPQDSGLLLAFIDDFLADRQYGAPVSNTSLTTHKMEDIWGLTIGCTVFGGLHLAAWNFEFPSRPEQIIWWATSLWCTCYMINWLLVMLVAILLTDKFISQNLVISFATYYLIISTILYILARLFIIVETFRTLCFLPPDAFISTWASNIPHVA